MSETLPMDRWIIRTTANKGSNVTMDPGEKLYTPAVSGLVAVERPSDITAPKSVAVQDGDCGCPTPGPPPKHRRRDTEETSSSTRRFREEWLTTYSWLKFDNGKVFCKVCQTCDQ